MKRRTCAAILFLVAEPPSPTKASSSTTLSPSSRHWKAAFDQRQRQRESAAGSLCVCLGEGGGILGRRGGGGQCNLRRLSLLEVFRLVSKLATRNATSNLSLRLYIAHTPRGLTWNGALKGNGKLVVLISVVVIVNAHTRVHIALARSVNVFASKFKNCKRAWESKRK